MLDIVLYPPPFFNHAAEWFMTAHRGQVMIHYIGTWRPKAGIKLEVNWGLKWSGEQE